MKRISKIWYVVGVIILIAVVSWLWPDSKKKEEVSFVTEKVAPANIQNSITATGSIEPVTEVTVGTQVSGIISKIYVDYNSEVKKGQVIAELDKTNLISTLNTAKANLNNAESTLNYQTANYKRYKELYDTGLVSADEYENALLTYKQAKEQVISAKESVQTAQTNLGYATITAPIDGVILGKAVEEGQTVASGFETPTLFTIAADLTKMQVVADVDEADIAGIKDSARVTFTVDAYPDDIFEGKVYQIRLGSVNSSSSSSTSTSSETVVTYEVVITADNPDLKLKPRLTANVTIYTDTRDNVITVPNKALRFTPEKQLVGNKTITDCEGTHKVWTMDANGFTAHPVKIGLSDGSHTEILEGLNEGTPIVTETVLKGFENNADEMAGSERSPFMPGPP